MSYSVMRLLILFLFLPFGISAQSNFFFDYPDGLLIDPDDYRLKHIGVLEIVQYNKVQVYNADTTKRDSTFNLSYVISYDTLGHVTSLKYDFRKHYHLYAKIRSTRDSAEQTIEEIYGPNSGLFVFQVDTLVQVFDYWEYRFVYDRNRLDKIEIYPPKPRFDAVLDGVYVKEHQHKNVSYEFEYNDRGQVVKETVLYGDENQHVIKYRYQEFQYSDGTIHSLLVGVSQNPFKRETTIHYEFYK